ncbi:MAG: hypothetical protein J2P21_02050 [Chloracidobacterium sp.]|nr:hypothetical protein [Chloracidobacterium sp.]
MRNRGYGGRCSSTWRRAIGSAPTPRPFHLTPCRKPKLFRTFGEDYHEKKLEEPYIFTAVKKAGGPAASYPDILVLQHTRGREITEYIQSVTQGRNLERRKRRAPGAGNGVPGLDVPEPRRANGRRHCLKKNSV